jgi:dipeptidyl aminopeptidase/acylaminoacyl peptidase
MKIFVLMMLLMLIWIGPLIRVVEGSSGKKNMPPLIPREVLFGNPVKASPTISPDGTRLAYLAPSDQGVMNVWVRTLGKENHKVITRDTHRGIRNYYWLSDSKRIIYFQDTHGDENYHVFLVDLKTLLVRDLTPFPGIRAVNVIPGDGQLLVGLNIRNPQLFDMYRIDLDTGALRLDTENPGDVVFLVGAEWLADSRHVIRAIRAMNFKDGSTVIRIRDGAGQPWRELITWPNGEIIGSYAIDFTQDGMALYVLSGTDSDTSRLLKIDTRTGKQLAVIAQHKHVDIWLEGILAHPKSRDIQAVAINYLVPQWQVLDPRLKQDFKTLANHELGHFKIISRDRGDTCWVIAYEKPDRAVSYWLYQRNRRDLSLIFHDRPRLKTYPLAQMKPQVIQARDGLKLPSYLTLPIGVKPSKLPMVLYVHGGPTARDEWQYDPSIQLLANRGYAVLQVNYRGSVGFGKQFQQLGNGQVGVGTMQHDLTDAVNWAIKKGYADPKRIAIMGVSYGGYATLAGLAFTPDLYACGIDGCGPSNLKSLFKSIPAYLVPIKNLFMRIFGEVEHNDALNRKISPLFHVKKIRAPLLIAQGMNDPRCPMHESDQMVKALRDNNRNVTYVVYSDEGHGFKRPENKLDYWGRIESFLAQHLGGRHEPHKKITGSTGKLH